MFQFTTFRIIFFAVAFAIPSKDGVMGTKTTPNAAASSSKCPKSRCLTDAISCLAGEKLDDGGNADQARKLAKLENEVASLKALLTKVGKPSGFAMLDSNGRLPQNLLSAGYDRYSAYDLAWQSLHMAAAAACRGSTSSGGTGCCDNKVMARNTASRKTCAQICAQTPYRNCDAEVSIYGKKSKATQNGKIVGAFYNYKCNHGANGGSEASVSDDTVMNYSYPYFSFCCCRK